MRGEGLVEVYRKHGRRECGHRHCVHARLRAEEGKLEVHRTAVDR